MNSSPHEICLITNNISFRPPLRRLDGALVDERRLLALFQHLDFDVYVKQDIPWIRSSQQQENLQQKTTASLTHSFSSLWLWRGGSNDVIFGVNGGTVSVAELACFFKSPECPTLQDKPKLFFFQACRGSGQDHSLTESGPVPSSSGTRMVSVSALSRTIYPQDTCFLLALSTAQGYATVRNTVKGSLFVEVSCLE